MTDEAGGRDTPHRRDDASTEESPGDGSTDDDRTDSDTPADAPDRGAGDTPSHDDQSDVPPGVAQSRRRSTRPRPEPGSRARDPEVGFITRFRTARSGPLLYIRETLYSAMAVLAVGLLLFAISGVWPPMVAVESGSMEPEMHRGDLVFVTEPHRFSPDYAVNDTGIVTVEVGTDRGYRSFGGNGSVVIYDPPDRAGSPIIHRAHFYVEEGENWYDRANPQYMSADDCAALSNCPAPTDGFITKGDANTRYDQASGIAGPVRTEWIRGTARLRIPYLGYVRLQLAGIFAA
ncbi:S26 family signal peptidase [Halobellus marinus]|uniref:S26 family signal peptidase n=2 Tax=cellular organisms TaxID=131567 RepID=UPI0028AC5544|nr:S26 family signal peptidase [Halobellus sp. DFY28]